EMAMRKKGEILGLAEIARPDYVLISSIGSTHIEFLGSKRNIALAKAEIFRFKKQKDKTYYTVLNQYMNYFDTVKTIAGHNGFQVKTIKEKDFLKSNQQIVTELALKLGIPKPDIQNVLQNFQTESPHRQTVIKWNNNILIDDTYNANPESMRFAIQKMIKDFPGHKKIVVIGEMKELGAFVEKEHGELIEYILNNKSINSVCFLGNTYKKIEKKQEKCYYFLEKTEVVQHLISQKLSNFALLFKGSRSIKMEEIIEHLLKKP
ncbi:MAG: cyanophycin synthetase, partial [Candidatus Margulisbacteria bacterium]|nr:cyanophycin synthetase [Candidatus Margulisiibacteriota bacterium]